MNAEVSASNVDTGCVPAAAIAYGRCPRQSEIRPSGHRTYHYYVEQARPCVKVCLGFGVFRVYAALRELKVSPTVRVPREVLGIPLRHRISQGFFQGMCQERLTSSPTSSSL